ncbi:MAG: acetolactate synthase small subunit [Candidatus Nezhaarchaeota archaeon]|nr:acetolactate synthase small subunit [Candidatus Nezhaarchaeota archaeon]MCX8141435.1 acetolactate synthase small subunit [Candidatus Nezhaarchaeota archaeon]MDW8049701.1 acetolactate synthase small subunit [Nitrososphaerota archaeon]
MSQKVEPMVIITVVEDRPGVLYKVSSVIRRKGINIDAITVAPTTEAGVSKMTFLVNTDSNTINQLVRQIEKVPTVILVGSSPLKNLHSRELALIKVNVSKPSDKEVIYALTSKFKAQVVEEEAFTMTIEIVGPPSEVTSFINQLKTTTEIVDLARTGPVVLSR